MTTIVKNSNKDKWVFGGCGIAFDGGDWWSFGNSTARNVIIFGVDSSSSSYMDNPKNNFLILSKCQTFRINGSFGEPEKKFSINFTKANTKFCLNLHYNGNNSYLFVNGTETIKFKANNKNVNLLTQFFLGSISDGLNASKSREVSLNGDVYNFAVDYNSIDKSDILNIQKYLTHYSPVLLIYTPPKTLVNL